MTIFKEDKQEPNYMKYVNKGLNILKIILVVFNLIVGISLLFILSSILGIMFLLNSFIIFYEWSKDRKKVKKNNS